MNASVSRRTWEAAASPAAVRLARKYEQAWRETKPDASRPDPRAFLGAEGAAVDGPGARLAVLRTDMSLRWEAGEKVEVEWYLARYADLGQDTIVALVYEEFCLREEDGGHPDPVQYLTRFSQLAGPLKRVLEIHDLVGSGTTASMPSAGATNGAAAAAAFPEAGESIAGFSLVEELGRGAFARVFLAREHELADRPVALKVTRRGSHEPQTLARLQHTHIVPVHSHQIETDTGLHLLCMPYFGRLTLARVLADPDVRIARTGAALVKALDRLEPSELPPAGRSAGRTALASRSYSQAIAWWGARLAEALDHAHERGVLHRDVKPSNVLVTADGMPMLLDFNLAREPRVEEGTDADATLGGTIDYMAPEQLRALAEGSSLTVDGRADLFGLGVVLFEAVSGKRPFELPRRSGSVVEVLLRAADLRQAPLPRLRQRHPEIPVALEAVIRRALAPDARDRYQRAAELAADLQAVADDLPLLHAREPWRSRAAGWFRRRRRRLAMAAAIVVAVIAVLAAAAGFALERARATSTVKREYDKGLESDKEGQYDLAKEHYDAASDQATHLLTSPWGRLAELGNVRALGSQLTQTLERLRASPDLEEIRAWAREKSTFSARSARVRKDADALTEAADGLRFRLLLGEGRELTQAAVELQQVLAPFYVLESSDWTKLDHTLSFLDPDRRERLRVEVDELLFHWMTAIDDSVGSNPDTDDRRGAVEDEQALTRALAICDRVLNWVEPKGPWRALRSRLQDDRALLAGARPPQAGAAADRLVGEPATVADEPSDLACFQWGLLCYRARRLPRAIDWLERAVRLKWDNYWYQFVLAFLEDTDGSIDKALNHYGVAAGLNPDSPGVLFSRARLYRAKGQRDRALDDIKTALQKLGDRPEAAMVHLELGYLYQATGDFARARAEYRIVIRSDRAGTYARAARLNQANMDAETGAVEQARREYGELLLLDLQDTAVRHSRAVLELRLGRAEQALVDLTALLEMRPGQKKLKNRDEILSARALALLLLGRPELAAADAAEAERIRPSPANERLRQRALLAARRPEGLELEWPEDVALLPVGGERLKSDLRAAARGLEAMIRAAPEQTYRASLTQAVILAALRQPKVAAAAATRALEVSPYSPRAYLIRARVSAFGGNLHQAWADVERGLSIQFNEPGLLELRGSLRAAAGDFRAALDDYDQAAVRGAYDRIHLLKASALAALGRDEAAVQEWSLALRRDPELPKAYLGRAQAQMSLRRWELALADLEQAASWAHGDPWTEFGIVMAYLKCLPHRPDRLPRWLSLTERTIRDLGQAVTARSSKPGGPSHGAGTK
jgi:serine/threonine protein kinase/lipoprotein NlpI